jgi:hypothetical protein
MFIIHSLSSLQTNAAQAASPCISRRCCFAIDESGWVQGKRDPLRWTPGEPSGGQLMMPEQKTPLMRRGSDHTPKNRREMRLRLEADIQRDFHDRRLGRRQQLLGAFYTPLRDILVRPQARRPTKQNREMHAAEAGSACHTR